MNAGLFQIMNNTKRVAIDTLRANIMPVISVVIPVYNSEKTIRETIDSCQLDRLIFSG
jgi:cellulose synthase/poly-beta-1,6-N-acetylglucosamine synthase-like glycosyltransferase